MRWIEEYNESEKDSGNKKKSVGSLTFVILDLSGELSVDVFLFVLVSLEILLNVLGYNPPLSAVSAIDTNGVSFFDDLRKALEKQSLEASQRTKMKIN